MIASLVTESYASLPHHVVIARIGTFELRLFEIPSVNAPEPASLWVELYDRNLLVGVDSCKCSDFDESIDAARFLMTQATRLKKRG
jgi:hypothetical protein